jgi:hypothetical protein
MDGFGPSERRSLQWCFSLVAFSFLLTAFWQKYDRWIKLAAAVEKCSGGIVWAWTPSCPINPDEYALASGASFGGLIGANCKQKSKKAYWYWILHNRSI